MIKVLLADDHHIVREGFRRIVEDAGDMEVVAEAADGQEGLCLGAAYRHSIREGGNWNLWRVQDNLWGSSAMREPQFGWRGRRRRWSGLRGRHLLRCSTGRGLLQSQG